MNESLKEETRDRDRQLFTQNERLCAMEALVTTLRRELDGVRGRSTSAVDLKRGLPGSSQFRFAQGKII